jgi:hypothetical protein
MNISISSPTIRFNFTVYFLNQSLLVDVSNFSIMGITYDGQESPIPQFEHWFEYAIALFCITQFAMIAYHVVLNFRSKARNNLSYMVRSMILVDLICTIAQSIHYFTPGHPFIHWLGATAFSLILAILVVCEMQILKKFTFMTSFLTDRKIKYAQITYFSWIVIFLIQACSYLSPWWDPSSRIFMTILANTQYQANVLFAVFYETWHALFLSYLIVRNNRIKSSITQPRINISFEKMTTTLLVYLAFMLSYLWFSVGMWLLAYTFPVQTTPWQTSLRILGNHLGLWYPVLIYYFFELLKNVQLNANDGNIRDSRHLNPPLLLLIDLKAIPKEYVLAPTVLLQSTTGASEQKYVSNIKGPF